MATIVTNSGNSAPWWAPLAVSVLGKVAGGLWDDWQEREKAKKESAYASEVSKMLTPQVADTPTNANATGQGGLLNTPAPEGYDSNGWASAFHKGYTPLTQYDFGTSGITPNGTSAGFLQKGPAPNLFQVIANGFANLASGYSPNKSQSGDIIMNANGGNGNNAWTRLLQGNNSALSQYDAGTSGIVPTAPAPSVTNLGQNGGLPTPLDLYRRAMELRGSKRFGMISEERANKILEPLMKQYEAARQEELRNALAQSYGDATDRASRLDVIDNGLINGGIDPNVATSLYNANKQTPYFTDTGDSILPQIFDSRTGQVIDGNRINKGMTPGETAEYAYKWGTHKDDMRYKYDVLGENARQFGITDNYNRWKAGIESDQKTITGQDGRVYQYDPQTNSYVPTNIMGGSAISPYDNKIIEDYDRQGAAVNAELNRLFVRRNNDARYGLDTTEIDKQIEANQAKLAQIQQARTAYITGLQQRQTSNQSASGNGQGQSLSLGTLMLGNANAGKISKNGYFGHDRGDHRHGGTDYPMKEGHPINILSRMGDTFTVVESRKSDSYGNTVVLETVLNGTKVRYRMAHMQDGSVKVKKGDKISAGSVIGNVGNTGNSTGPHLHLEVQVFGKDGWQKVDPETFLRDYGTRQQETPQVTGLGLPPVDPKYLQNQPPLGQSQGTPAQPVSGDTSPSTAQGTSTPSANTTAWRDKDGNVMSAQKVEAGIKEAESKGFDNGIKNREDFYAELRRRGYEPVTTGQNTPTVSTDIPALAQTPPSPISGDLGISPRTTSSDITPDMASMPSVDPLDYRPSYMRTNLPSAINPIQHSGTVARINPSSSISFATPALASTPRSPEMPQASVQETSNTQQALAMLNDQFAPNGFDDEYPFLESDDIWPLHNDPIEDPNYSPIPNIDQPIFPRVVNGKIYYPYPLMPLPGSLEDLEHPMRNVIPIPNHDPSVPQGKMLMYAMNRRNRNPFRTFN